MARRFMILGPLEVFEGDEPLPLGGPRQRAVLAVLLLHAGETVSAARLVDEIWGDQAPDTAASVLQTYVSLLRRALGRDTIATQAGGYSIRLGRDELDLRRFEQLVGEAEHVPPPAAAGKLREALALWRGPALAEFDNAPFAQSAGLRLEELRLAAVERRLEVELGCDRHAEIVGELETLVAEHPLRERLCALLMLALYRSGRQAESLDAYRSARRMLVDRLGLEPSPALQELEKAILRQEPSLVAKASAAASPPTPSERSILVAPRADASILPLVTIGEPLARRPPRELIVVRLLAEDSDPVGTTSSLIGLRDELVGRGLGMRIAAYSSSAPAEDLLALSTAEDVDLVLVDAPPSLLADGVPDADLALLLRDALCDVAMLVGGSGIHRETTRPVVVPFGGAPDDWSAVELAAWIARALGTTLMLAGTAADRLRGRRDASRLLAQASLVVQAVVGIVAEPALVHGGVKGVVEAAAGASLLVLGVSPRWQLEGLGSARLEVARTASAPVLLVRRGLRPGGLATGESLTRFTWTLGSQEP